MKSMVLQDVGRPLEAVESETPAPDDNELLIEVSACGVCRTDLHVVDGELPGGKLPVVPGHEVIGRVAECGAAVRGFRQGQRVGVPWLGATCGHCWYCEHDQENLCDEPAFTGFDRDGGFATHIVADARYTFPIDADYDDAEAAPLMCAGLIGYRSWRMAGEGRNLGLYGFGAAAHILIQVALHRGQRVYAFTRPGDTQAQEFALRMGAEWAGGSDEAPPAELDAAILFAPVGELVPAGLRAVRKGGIVVCGGIHMSDIPSFPYRILWEERRIRSVANLTRQDAVEFLDLAPRAGVRTEVTTYPLEDANAALEDLRLGRLSGAAVLVP
ncbi:zinc-dependent alcohol dehydrogenase family protein [Lentisalinibacter salinarum]|uniref:zinc-dependent alcohol dehydrogenase family protein n=1 Tax=Lentisalinibacter salinarum TaxID=2992239 RepID=UPI0038658874